MGSWIVVGVQLALSLITLIATLVAVQWARSASQEGEKARKLAEALAEAFRRGHGEPCPQGAPELASPSPAPVSASEPVPALARSAAAAAQASPPRSGRRETPAPISPPPVTRPSTAPGDARAARTTSSHPPPPVAVLGPDDAPTSDDIRAAYHAEADAKDTRDAAQEGDRAARVPPAPAGAVPPLARVQGAPGGDDEETLKVTALLPRVEVDDDARDTGEEGTKVWSREKRTPVAPFPGAQVQRRRPTLLGLVGVPLERPVSDPSRIAEAFRKAHPSSPTLVSEGATPPPSSSAPRAIPLERVAALDAATLDRVDTLAEALGMTREAVLSLCAERGIEHVERLHRDGPPPTDRSPKKG